MATEPITLKVSPEMAKAYREAAPKDRAKIALLCDLWLRSLAERDATSLEEAKQEFLKAVHKIQDQAEANGITPEILESILNER